MSDLEFSRERVGVKAKESWTDSDTFAIIGSEAGRLDPASAFSQEPLGDRLAGVGELRAAFDLLCVSAAGTIMELSDACAVLGSGTDSAVSNMDETEQRSSFDFEELHRRMSGGDEFEGPR
ncbi:hypothetical protein EII34_06410 [Arachnia propionica]|uniref:Uncharacterized protein n=1 Tax=Arachnia propionica TaxID=1750 RepID=A0A3P1TA87_9ACTN|nr:hypothetical protein [Arachnia propionica]MDO5083539.1 hypothetical protein [Arachnia propionica]RRD05363.1 hypothetical protein EII34_06410 [Arachnia propionica]